MHQSGPGQSGQFRVMMQQGIDQRTVTVARSGMNHQPRGLVDHQQISIFVAERQRHILGNGDGFGGHHQFAADGFAASDWIAGAADLTVDPQVTGLQPMLQPAARIGGQ